MVVCTCHLCYVGGSWARLTPGKTMGPYIKNTTKAEKGWGMAQMIEHLPIKCKGPRSTHSTAKNKRNKAILWW
jgi:hypothetical protein